MSINTKETESPEDRRLLATATLFRRDFVIDWLVSLTGDRIFRCLGILQKAVECGWLSSPSTGVFCVERLPKEYYSQIDPDEREALRRRLIHLLMNESWHSDNSILNLADQLLVYTSNDLEKCRWLVKAGDLHLEAYRNDEAVQCYTKAIQDLRRTDGPESDSLFIHVTIKYSKISTAKHQSQKVRSLLKEALKRADRCSDQSGHSLLEMHLAKIEWLGSRYDAALRHFDRGWQTAKKLKDPKLMRSATVFSTFFLYWQGRFKEALRNYEKIVPNVAIFPQGRFPMLAGMIAGQCYAFTGEVSQALGMLDAAFSHCMEMGDISLAANAEGTIGSIMLLIHRIKEAIVYLRGALEKAQQKQNYFLVLLTKISLAYAYYLIHDQNTAVSYFEQFLKQSDEVRVNVRIYPYLMDLCWAMEQGKFPRIRGLSVEEEVGRMIKSQNVFLKGVAYRYRALIENAAGSRAEQVLRSLSLSSQFVKESGHRIEYAITQLELARQYIAMDIEDKAKPLISAAGALFSSLGEHIVPEHLRFLITESPSEKRVLDEILQISQEIVAIRTHNDLIQHIIGVMNGLVGAERGAIFLLEKEDARSALPVLRGSKNLTSENIHHANFSQSMKIIQEVAQSGRPQIWEQSSPARGAPLSGQIGRACICLPMILRQRVMGVLYFDKRFPESSFETSDLGILSYFATLGALALDNSNAYEEIQRLNERLTEEKLYYKEEHPYSRNFESVVGQSSAISNVLAQVAKVAKTDSNVLILGETGVGKELVANEIHRQSRRADNPFIGVNCSSLPESLIASELFGHEKGSFTGADRRRIGRFELADGGTIFLDEIGDLPLEMQLHLLRVLQTKKFERVGSSKTIHSDFRLVAATNKDLKGEVAAGRFRSDLYYRLNVFPITVPPLRERKADIPLLASHFLALHTKRLGKNIQSFSKETMEKLIRYKWPGNIRELENIIERGAILTSGNDFILPEGLLKDPAASVKTDENVTLEENERRHIRKALERSGWKVRGSGGAAELLRIHPSTLTFRMKKLGIRPPRGFPKKGRPVNLLD